MISLLVSDFRKISVSVPSIPVAVLGLSYEMLGICNEMAEGNRSAFHAGISTAILEEFHCHLFFKTDILEEKFILQFMKNFIAIWVFSCINS